MRIILITSKLNFKTAGGSVLDLHLKAKGLADLGHDVTVITAFSHANIIEQSLPYKVVEENIDAPNWPKQLKNLYYLLRKYQSHADAFYIDGNLFVYGGGAYRLLGGKIPVVAFFNIKLSCWSDTQGNDEKKKNIFSRLKRRLRLIVEHYVGTWIANHLDAFIFTTPMVEKWYLDFGYKKNKTRVIPDFVNTWEIIATEHRTDATTRQHQINADPIVLLCSGRMIPEKGFDQVIKALARVKNKDHIKLIMSGGGSEAEQLKTLAQELGLTSQVVFPGWVEKKELITFFRHAHIFILPKWWLEYTSVLLIEAMAYGLPSIVPGGGGLEWLTPDASLTFAMDNVDELAARIEELCADSELRIKLALGAREQSASLDAGELAKRLESTLRIL